MRWISFILLLITLFTQGSSQVQQPKYIGDAVWVRSPKQQEPDKLPVTIRKFRMTKKVSKNNSRTITQRKIYPGTRVIHLGKTLPILQIIRISGNKLTPPEITDAPSLQTRDNAAFNISYTDKQHGFAGSNSTDFAEDAEHNIWIASDAGLIRYDGYHYFMYNQKNGLPDMPNLSLAYDHQNRLWLASENGVYYIRHDSLFSFQSEEIDFSKIASRKVQIDASQRVWVSTKKNGAICIDESSIQIFDKRCGLPVEYIMAIHLDKKGNLFLATHDSGIILIAPEKMLMLFSANKDITPHIFLSLYENEEGIWAGSFSSGLVRMGSTDTIQYSISGRFDERIYDIKKAPGGLWLSSYDNSVCYFNAKKLLIIDESNGLLNRFPFFLFEDSFKNIWVSSMLSGFSRINENCFYVQDYENPAIKYVRAVLPDNKNGNWIITEGNNLVYQKGSTATSFLNITNQVALFLYALDGILNENGTLWMGSYGAGIVHVKETDYTVYSYSDFVDYQVIRSIKKDIDNKVWFCPTSFGLILYDNKQFWHYTPKSGLLSNLVNQLFLDADKKIHWTFANGFQRLGKSGIETLFIGNNQLKDQVNGMLAVDDKTTLLATNDNGLLLINNNRVYQLTTAYGLSSNRIKTIIRDVYGKIWISTDKGIETFVVKNISITEHTVYNQANGSYILNSNSVLLDTTGLPFWSIRENKLIFNPDFLHRQNKSLIFSIRQILVNDKIQQDTHSSLSVLPDQKINIYYTAIFWGREQNLEMKYLLISDRGDTSIYSSGNKGHITISEILPSKYRVILTAQDNNHTYYSAPVYILVNEFWYNTWLFRIFGACLLITGIISYFRRKATLQEIINTQLKNRVAEQTNQIVKEKEDLQKSYEVIDHQNQEKDILIQEINHRVKNNLQLIAAMVEMQMSNDHSKGTLLALLGTARRIKAMSLVHELLYYKKDIQGLSTVQYVHELIDNLKEMASNDKHPIDFRIEVEDIYIDSRSAIALGMIISELVSNSFKYAFKKIPSPEITIRLTKDPKIGYLHLLVADNGNGFNGDYDAQKGLGSRLVDIFSRQLEGNYSIDYNNHFIFMLTFKPVIL